VGALALAMAAGTARSLRVTGELPKLGLDYLPHLRNLEERRDYEALAGQWRLAAAIGLGNRHVAYSNLGHVLGRQGRLEEGIAALRRALEIRPDYAVAHNNLGALLAQLGRYGPAIAHLRRALELDPGLEGARDNLERALGLAGSGLSPGPGGAR
jgi:tetratricopeptide (TPR) repeat protein